MSRPAPVQFGADPITVDDLLDIADGARVRIGPASRTRMTLARRVIEAALADDAPVYGLTRQLGSGATEQVPIDQAEYQRQVIRNHAAGLGAPLPADVVRAGIAAHLAALTRGGSGVRPEVADALAALLNGDVDVVVPERGSVGAADLAQLAAVAAVLIGDGTAFVAEAPDEVGSGSGAPPAMVPGAEALRAARLEPLELAAHEALSLINTNAFTVGATALLMSDLGEIASAAGAAAALSIEAAAAHRASGDLGPFSAVVNAVRGDNSGQAVAAAEIRRHLKGSFVGAPDRERHVQDELSFRSVAQVHGTLNEAYIRLRNAVTVELAAAPSNPLVHAPSGTITPNGNFHTLALALELESVRLVLAHVAALSERRISTLSGLLQPFRAAGATRLPGIIAYTAAADLAELRQLAAPVTLTATTLDAVEDAATFGWSAVQLAERSADLALEILAIEALHAADLLALATPRPVLGAGTDPVRNALGDVLAHDGTANDMIAATIEVLVSPA